MYHHTSTMPFSHGTLRRLTNAQIADSRDYGNFSLQQSQIGVE